MLAITDDGRFLALAASDGEPAKSLYIFSIGDLISGGVTADKALVPDFTLDAAERIIALTWSLDGTLLFLLTQADKATHLWRYQFEEGTRKLILAGRGVELSAAPLDLSVSPGERWAFVLTADAEAGTELSGIDMEMVKARSEEGPAKTAGQTVIRIDGDGRSLARDLRGTQLFVAASDSNTETAPDRGLVAVIKIAEAACGDHFKEAIDGCPACAADAQDHEHAVILADLPAYKFADLPRIEDAGNGGIGAGRDRQRHLSADCPFGDYTARGDRVHPGTGHRRRSAGAARRTRTAGTAGHPWPARAAGISWGPRPARGTRRSWDRHRRRELQVLPPGSQPTVTVASSPQGLVVTIGLPDTAKPLDLNHIVAISWIHNAAFPDPAQFSNLMNSTGIAIEFANEVPFAQFTGTAKPGVSMLVELQARHNNQDSTFCWCPLTRINVFPLDEIKNDGNGRVTEFKPNTDGRETTKGIALIANDVSFSSDTYRVLVRADYILDRERRPLDGNFIGGTLPTGNGVPGDDFLSWFTVPAAG